MRGRSYAKPRRTGSDMRMTSEKLGSESANLHCEDSQHVVYGTREPNAYAGASDIHDDVARGRYSPMTKQLIGLDAGGSDEAQENGVKAGPSMWRKASNG